MLKNYSDADVEAMKAAYFKPVFQEPDNIVQMSKKYWANITSKVDTFAQGEKQLNSSILIYVNLLESIRFHHAEKITKEDMLNFYAVWFITGCAYFKICIAYFLTHSRNISSVRHHSRDG